MMSLAAIIGADKDVHGAWQHPLVGVGFVTCFLGLSAFFHRHGHGERPKNARAHHHHFSPAAILSAIAVLIGMGLAALVRLSPPLAYKQVGWLWLGAIFLVVISRWPVVPFLYRRRALIGLALAITPFITLMWGTEFRGARIWLDVGWRWQPVEAVKVLFVVVLAAYLMPAHKATGCNGQKSFLRHRGAIVSIVGAVVVGHALQKDWGQSALLLAVAVSMVFLASPKPLVVFGTSAPVIVGAVVVASRAPHIAARLLAWLQPFRHFDGAGYQIAQATFAFGAGGGWGTGWGRGLISHIPVVHSDMILSAIAEEKGFVGGAIVLVAAWVLIATIVRHSMPYLRTFPGLVTTGIALLWVYQTAFVVGGNLRLWPLTGMTVPFVSYGGSSFVASFIGIGFVVSAFTCLSGEAPVQYEEPDRKHRDLAGNFTVTRVLRFGVVTVFTMLSAALLWATGPGGIAGKHHPGNPRQYTAEAMAARGGIYDRRGEMLAGSVASADGVERVIVGPLSVAHTVGVAYAHYGMTGLENRLSRRLSQGPVMTTIDGCLQAAVQSMFVGVRGAAIGMNPRNGEVLFSVSSPWALPENDVSATSPTNSEEAPFFNRVTLGQYAPGSTIKPFVMAAALDGGVVTPWELIPNAAEVVIGGRRIRNTGDMGHDVLTVNDALAMSSNTVFSRLAAVVPPSFLRHYLRQVGIGVQPAMDIATTSGVLPSLNAFQQTSLRAEIGIGHGGTLMSPLQMVRAVAVIANGGHSVVPTIVLPDTGGRHRPEKPGVGKGSASPSVMTPGTAQIITDAMVLAVKNGTAFRAQVSDDFPVAGKTGTVSVEGKAPHALFIGFAPAYEPELAVAIVVENAGAGGSYAAPIARQIFAHYVGQVQTGLKEGGPRCPIR